GPPTPIDGAGRELPRKISPAQSTAGTKPQRRGIASRRPPIRRRRRTPAGRRGSRPALLEGTPGSLPALLAGKPGSLPALLARKSGFLPAMLADGAEDEPAPVLALRDGQALEHAGEEEESPAALVLEVRRLRAREQALDLARIAAALVADLERP